jgi:hypothetical protein
MRVENFIVMMEQIPLMLGQTNMVHPNPKKLPMMKMSIYAIRKWSWMQCK